MIFYLEKGLKIEAGNEKKLQNILLRNLEV